MEEIVITEEKVIDALSKVKESSSHPDNDIPASVIKNCRYSLALPLKIMFSRSYEQGIVPKYYKFQSITPLFKKGCKTAPSNFRPISITSHIIKTLELKLLKHISQLQGFSLYESSCAASEHYFYQSCCHLQLDHFIITTQCDFE